MESSIAEFLMWQLAYEQLPTYHNITSVLCVTVAILAQGTHWAVASLQAFSTSAQRAGLTMQAEGAILFSAPASPVQTQTQPCERAPRTHTHTSAHACARARLCPTATATTTTADHRGRRVVGDL